MRRLLTIISAILLALLVVGAFLAYRGDQFSIEGILSGAQDIFRLESSKEEEKLPNLPEQPAPEEEENLSYEERLKKGDYYFERGFLTFASNEYVKAANLEPDRVEPYLKLLKTHFELRNYKKALNNAEIALKLRPSDLETRFNVILVHIKLSEFEKAQELLNAYPVTEPADPEVLYYKGLLASLFGQSEEANRYLKEAKVVSTDLALTTKIDELLGAYQEFEIAKAAEPLYQSELLARAYNKVGEYEMAIHLLKEVLRARSDLRDGWILFGFAYLNLEKYQFALTAFEKAYSLDSEWPTTQYFLGVTHKELANFQDAITYFNLALANSFEPRVVIQRHLADLYFETEDYEKAVKAYEEVLEVSKGDVNAFVRPVWLYIDFLNEPESAKKLAETAVLTFPDSAMSFNLLGWSYQALGDEKKGENNLKKAIELDPNLAAAHYNLGKLYESQGKNEPALTQYQTAYDLDASGSIGNMAAESYNELLRLTINN